MRIFVSYRHTGAEPHELKKLLTLVRDTLVERGFEVYINYFDPKVMGEGVSLNGREFLEDAFGHIDQTDWFLIVQSNIEKSEGMLIETGYALAKQIPIAIAKRRDVSGSYLHEIAKVELIWEDLAELAAQLKTVNFES